MRMDGTARLWDASSGRLIRTVAHQPGHVNGIAPGPGGVIATAGSDGRTRIWDPRRPRSPIVLKGHRKEVVSVDFSADGARLVTASDDRTAAIWDWRARRRVRVLRDTGILGRHFQVGDDESIMSLAEIMAQLGGLDSDAVTFAEPPWRKRIAFLVPANDAESMAEQEGVIHFEVTWRRRPPRSGPLGGVNVGLLFVDAVAAKEARQTVRETTPRVFPAERN